ncbi:hypothetical protein PRIPAC_94095 [Pristionchus pacificus]|uniref:RING-type domain-containing protein n=1 Tax=Pristionchus pacificus TaxID=54126 RepID=A0A2A6BAV0_PRIPA|nr:hypothetical protein PRIPAC_94095 [Pristionchus pacificus]|eukprot:PDM63019.1 hypothetical protein PRIPAC_50234 [Pristionchus pacificus]
MQIANFDIHYSSFPTSLSSHFALLAGRPLDLLMGFFLFLFVAIIVYIGYRVYRHPYDARADPSDPAYKTISESGEDSSVFEDKLAKSTKLATARSASVKMLPSLRLFTLIPYPGTALNGQNSFNFGFEYDEIGQNSMDNFYNALNDIYKYGGDVSERSNRARAVYHLMAAKGCRSLGSPSLMVEGLVAKGYAKDEITKWRWYTGATILVCNGEGFAKRQNMVEQNPDAKGLCRKAMVIHAKASDAERLLAEHNPRLMVYNRPNLDLLEQMENSIKRACGRSPQGLQHIIVCVKPSQMDEMRAKLARLLEIEHFRSMVSVRRREIKDLELIHQAAGRLQGLSIGHPSLTLAGAAMAKAIHGHHVLASTSKACDQETQTPDSDRYEDCVVCAENRPDTVMANSGHMVMCQKCEDTVIENGEPLCPICHVKITTVGRDLIRIYP